MADKPNPDDTTTENLQRALLEGADLDEFIYHNVDIFDEKSFHGQLALLQRRTPYAIKDIINGTYIDPSYCYQIFRGIRTPSRNKIIQICLFLEFSLQDLNRLLKLAGHSSLYIKRLRDTVLIHGFNTGLSLDEVEELLIEKNCESLTDS